MNAERNDSSAQPGRVTPSPNPHELEAMDQFLQALRTLQSDTVFILRALIDEARVLSETSTSARNGLDPETRELLLELGAFTADQLARADARVKQGSITSHTLIALLQGLDRTITAQQAAAFMRQPTEQINDAYLRGKMVGYLIAGQMRFPLWQFHNRTADRLLPGLGVVASRLNKLSFHSGSGFMTTPQDELIGLTLKTPAVWLSDGGDPSAITELLDDMAII